jgi:hypothetical protein
MGKPTTQIAAAWTREQISDHEWRELDDVVYAALRTHWLGQSEDDLWEFVEDQIEYIAGLLRQHLASDVLDGVAPSFEIDSEPTPYVRAVARPPSELLSKLRNIDPFVFEEVCADVLKKLGADSYVTQKTNDGGIDFLGTNLSIVPAAFSIPQNCRATVIGQAKRYKETNTIPETKLREFVGAATLRAHKLRLEGKIGPLSPVIMAFWTTSDFDQAARDFGRAIGIWYMGGVTLSTYIEKLGLTDVVMALPNKVP